MSNQFLKLRRSSVPGKVPTTSSIDYGEIALNTYDGLAFIKKSGSNGEEIVVIGSTSGSFTGSFFGTSSWSINAVTASYVTASNVYGPFGSNSVISSSYTLTASYALNAGAATPTFPYTGSAIISGALVVTGSVSATRGGFTGSLLGTSSWAQNVATASWSINSLTASSADNFTVRQNITASNALFTGTITAQTLVVQTVTSSIAFVTGSTKFGSQSTDTHQFTGSVSVSGSLSIIGSLNATSSWAQNVATASYVTGSNVYGPFGSNSIISSSYALTASYVLGGSSTINIQDEGAAQGSAGTINFTGAGVTATVAGGIATVNVPGAGGTTFPYTGSAIISGSLIVTGSVSATQGGFTGSLLGTASWAQNAVTASYVTGSNVYGPFGSNSIISSSYALSSSYTLTASYALNAAQASSFPFTGSAIISGALIVTGSVSATQGGFTGSLLGTSSWSQNAVTASFVTASNVWGPYGSSSVLSSSFALTASYVTGSVHNSSNPALSASYALSSSYTISASYAANGGVTSFNTRTGAVTLQATDVSGLGAGIVSSSTFSSNAQGTFTSSINGVSSSFSLGLRTTDNVTFAQITGSDALFTGTITAQRLSVQYITASTEFVTGSSKFGSSSLDTHQFTGSVSISGSLTVVGPLNATSSWAQNAVTASYVSGSVHTSSNPALSASYALSSSFTLLSLTSSFVTASNVYGPFGSNSVISSSYALTASHIIGGASTINIQDEGSPQGSAGTINFVGAGVNASVGGGVATVTITGGGGGSITVADEGVAQGTATFLNFIGNGVSATVSSNTASIVINATGSTALHTQASPAVTWSFNHNLNNLYPVLNVWDSNGFMIMPGGVKTVSANLIEIYFDTTQAGYASAVVGGTAVSASYALTASFVATSSWAQNVATASYVTASNVYGPFGSNSVISSSYALTASYVLGGASTIAIQDEGSPQGSVGTINFVGAGVTSTVGGGTATVTIPGAGGTTFPYTGSAIISGALIVTGSVSATQGGFTGSLLGTSSWSQNAATASYINNLNQNLIVTGSLTVSNSLNIVGIETVTGSLIVSNSLTVVGSTTITGSLNITSFGLPGVLSQSAGITFSYVSGSTVSNVVIFASASSFGPRSQSLYISGNLEPVRNGNSTSSFDLGSRRNAWRRLYVGLQSVYFIDEQTGFSGSIGINTSSLALEYNSIPIVSPTGTSSLAQNAISSSYPISVSGSSLYSVSPAAGPGFSTQASIFFGASAGKLADYAEYSNFIGNQAGFWAYTASYSNFLGFNAGFNAENASSSNFIGRQSGQSAKLAEKSNFLGFLAGASAVSASYSTLIGFNVGAEYLNYGNSIGRNNIIIGTSITLPYNYQNGINIGGLIFGSGSYFNNAEGGTNPFSGSSNGRIGINQPNPQYSLDVSGSLYASNGIFGSLLGTSSWAQNVVTASYVSGSVFTFFNPALSASYALTASYALNGGGGPATATNFIASGIVTASVENSSNGIFLIKSGSVNMFEISGSGRFTANSSLFIIKNYTTQQPVFTVSESVVKFATQSAPPTGNADPGAFWITATDLYIGLN